MKRVLVTGATGLVGHETVDQLARVGEYEVVGVSTRRSARGTTVAWEIGSENPPAPLQGNWDVVVHAAADTRWTMTPEEASRANVATVAALEPLVSGQTHVVHVSTAYATGLRGDGMSDELDDYRNTYEWSKAHAERLARSLFPRLTIVRPPLIVGRRSDGRAARFSGMYTILRCIAGSMLPAVVGVPDAYLDTVPVDDVAALLVEGLEREPAGEVATIAGGDGAPRVADALELISAQFNEWRAAHGCEPFDTPRIVSPESWNRFFLPFARDHLTERQLRLLDVLGSFEPYLRVTEALEPGRRVDEVEAPLGASVRYWADQNRRLASLPLRPWKTAA